MNFYRASISFLAAITLTACNSPDFGKIKPDLGQIKKIPASILNIGKNFDGSKNENTAVAIQGTPLPLRDILGGSLAT